MSAIYYSVPSVLGLSITCHGTIKRVTGRGKTYHKHVWLNYDGYPTIACSIEGKTRQFKVHRLLAEVFIPNPEGLPLVRHLNDIRDDNRLCNLAWGTPQDNMDDMVRNSREVRV